MQSPINEEWANVRRYLIYAASGILFWIPSILIHAITRQGFGTHLLDDLMATILPVVIAAATLDFLKKKHKALANNGAIAVWMLFGIWFSGTFMMMISSSFTGGGFASADGFAMIPMAIIMFPLTTFVGSAYDGTLFGLIIVTCYLVIQVLWVLISGLSYRLRS